MCRIKPYITLVTIEKRQTDMPKVNISLKNEKMDVIPKFNDKTVAQPAANIRSCLPRYFKIVK